MKVENIGSKKFKMLRKFTMNYARYCKKTEFHVWVYLLCKCNDEMEYRATFTDIANDIGANKGPVSEAVEGLAKLGLLNIKRRATTRRNAIYQVAFHPKWETDQPTLVKERLDGWAKRGFRARAGKKKQEERIAEGFPEPEFEPISDIARSKMHNSERTDELDNGQDE